MSILENPTPEHIRNFCRTLEEGLLIAQARGDDIILERTIITQPVSSDFGRPPVDYTYEGGITAAHHGEAARRLRRKLNREGHR